MADAIYGWMQNLAFFFIFMTAVLNCIPDGQYRKYVRFFLGLVLLIVLSTPLLKLFSQDELLTRELSRAVLEQEAWDAENMQITVEGLQEKYFWDAYEQELEQQIASLLEGRGIGVRSVEVQIGTGGSGQPAVEAISLVVFNPEKSIYGSGQQALDDALAKEMEEAAKELSQVYRVGREHIYVKQE